MNILYICTGNTCRSPMAKVLTEVEADKRNIGHNVRSRGMAAHDGEGMSHGALKALAEEGINGSFHRAKTLSEKDLEWADKIYVMTHTMAANLKRGWQAYGGKIEPFAEKDVIDPFGADMTIYRFTKNSLMKEIERKFEEDEL